jgi:hypothetical protein
VAVTPGWRSVAGAVRCSQWDSDARRATVLLRGDSLLDAAAFVVQEQHDSAAIHRRS